MMVVVIVLLALVGTLALAAQPIQVEGIVRQAEAAQLRVGHGALQVLALKLHHLAALGASLVLVRVAVLALLVLG